MDEKKYAVPASLGMLLTGLIWGFAFVVVKSSLDFISTEYMLAFRFTIAAVALGLIFIKKWKLMSLRYLLNGTILGFLLFLSYALQTYGCEYTTAGKNAFLTTIYVVLVPFLAWFINKKKPDVYCVIGAVLGIAGLALLSLGGDDFAAKGLNIGDALTIACGFGYAAHMIYIDKFTEKQDPVLLTMLQLCGAAVFSWILALVSGKPFPDTAFSNEVITSMLYLGLLSTMVAFLLQNVCQKYTDPNVAALCLSTESVFGTLFSVLLLSETMTLKMLAGCLLLFVAVITVETKFSFLKKKKA